MKHSPPSLVIQGALDELCSSRSSDSDKSLALTTLEHFLATICLSKGSESTAELEAFLACQDTFECNIPSRVLAWISSAIVGLEVLMNKTSTIDHDDREQQISSMSSHLIQSLSIVQGVALNHKSSKCFLGRRHSLQILLDLLLASRHLSSSPQRPNHESSSTSGNRSMLKPPPTLQLASALLDTLLCILVDSPVALRAFEEANGIQVVVKILKRAGTPREVRMKCLEFLYFYLLDERSFTTPPTPQRRTGSESSLPVVVSAIPTSPSSKQKRFFDDKSEGQLLPAFTFEPRSKSDNFSDSFDLSLKSPQKSASWLLNTSPPPLVHNASSNTSWPSSATTPSQPRTPPRSRTQSGSSTKPFLMLRREVDFLPMTPKKSQVVGLSVGTPPVPFVSTRAKTPSNKKYRNSELGRSFSPRSEKENITQPTKTMDVRIKTTEEKKELLGTMLGNVDTLVEGMKKAGIWGLG